MPDGQSSLETPFTRQTGARLPIICGPMYPCSNPELVGAAARSGAMAVFQPISLTYVHGHDFRDGVRLIRRLGNGVPFGMNALIEASSRTYHERMVRWVGTALEEGVRFFVTSLGNPRWVVDRVHAAGGIVYHDVTEAKWARKGADAGVNGLIAVNRRAGGHAGSRTAEALLEELSPFQIPVICAGGVGDADDFVAALRLGYAGVQMGTRFIATVECSAHAAYKEAIVEASEDDITLTERLTGIPVAVIRTPFVDRVGTRIGPVARWLFRGRRTRRWMRTWYALRSIVSLRRANSRGDVDRDYWQAGKSVAGIRAIEPVATILERFEHVARREFQAAALAAGGNSTLPSLTSVPLP